MPDYFLNRVLYGSRSSSAYGVFLFIGVVLAIVIFVLFMPKGKRSKYLGSPSLLVMHDFLNFRKMVTTWLLKLTYIILACVLTLFSLMSMFDSNFIGGLLSMLMGNIFLRVFYEMILVLFSIHENISTIADKLTDRRKDDGADISAGQFLSDVGSKLKKQQEKIRAYAESERSPGISGDDSSPAAGTDSGAPAVCPNCGHVINGGGAFCANCGQKL